MELHFISKNDRTVNNHLLQMVIDLKLWLRMKSICSIKRQKFLALAPHQPDLPTFCADIPFNTAIETCYWLFTWFQIPARSFKAIDGIIEILKKVSHQRNCALSDRDIISFTLLIGTDLCLDHLNGFMNHNKAYALVKKLDLHYGFEARIMEKLGIPPICLVNHIPNYLPFDEF
jgi:hypothetical protein